MKIDCIHGYFQFTESSPGQVSDFMSNFGVELESMGNYYTFADLVEAPNYSLPGGDFLGCPTTKAFAGDPWDVMRANKLVYDFTNGIIVPIESISNVIAIRAAGNIYIATGIILPGSIMDDGLRVTDYAAFFDNLRFRYSEVTGG